MVCAGSVLHDITVDGGGQSADLQEVTTLVTVEAGHLPVELDDDVGFEVDQ